MTTPADDGRTEQVPTGFTRRHVLKGFAAGAAGGMAATLAGGAGLAAAQAQPTVAPEVSVTLQTAGWPFGPLPTAEEREADPVAAAYAETLQGWLDLNPGVALELVSVNIWGDDELVPAVAGGTAPAWYLGSVLGGYNDYGTLSAFQQGLAADVTELVQRYGINGKIADYVRGPWEGRWQPGGKAFGSPVLFNTGHGVYYRRDLIAELGLQEPQPGWTWDDFRALATGLTAGDRKGVAMQSWGVGFPMEASGYTFLSTIPDPDASWHWRRDLTSRAERWAGLVQGYRDMVYDEGTVLSDISFGDGECADAFSSAAAGMYLSIANFYTQGPTGDQSPTPLAEQLGKPLDEVVGWIQHPVGDMQVAVTTQTDVDLISFSPDLDADALDKAFNLYDYMFFGPGFAQSRRATYEATQDLRQVFGDVAPVGGQTTIEGVPGTAADAWGQRFVDAVQAAIAVPLVPTQEQYIPLETNPGPTGDAFTDMQSRWSYEPGDIDVAEDLRQLEETANSQASGFESSVSRDEFVAGAKAYYAAHTAFWEQHAPDFYAGIYRPWYDEQIAPALGG